MAEIISQYVVLVVLGICLCLGYVIKHSISFIPNKFIPLILAITGIILNIWINDWTITPEIILGGMASGLASTGAFELVRNIVGESSESQQEVTQEIPEKKEQQKSGNLHDEKK
ncbi:MAG TPA: holin [Lachnospiraceae bacterium]|jgi:hypothetical protein|nr:holin [Lachnospiraceae bacterium]HCR40500.1 holin [Lachnospiraceae bacterium]